MHTNPIFSHANPQHLTTKIYLMCAKYTNLVSRKVDKSVIFLISLNLYLTEVQGIDSVFTDQLYCIL